MVDPRAGALFSLRGNTHEKDEATMKTMLKLLIPLGFVLMTGCVVAPYGYHRGYYGGYYGPRVGVIAPAPVVVVR